MKKHNWPSSWRKARCFLQAAETLGSFLGMVRRTLRCPPISRPLAALRSTPYQRTPAALPTPRGSFRVAVRRLGRRCRAGNPHSSGQLRPPSTWASVLSPMWLQLLIHCTAPWRCISSNIGRWKAEPAWARLCGLVSLRCLGSSWPIAARRWRPALPRRQAASTGCSTVATCSPVPILLCSRSLPEPASPKG